MPNVSIAVSAQDNFSSAIKSMSQVTKGFSKDAEDMQKKLNMLNQNKISLKVEADKAKSELSALEKQFKKTGSEADGLKMQLANDNYENIRRNLGLVAKGAKDAEKAMVSLGTASSKLDNRASTKGKISEIGTAMFAQGAGNMVGQLMMSGANYSVGSAFGAETGSVVGGALSNAASMGAMGFAIAGPVGAAVGSAVGAALGGITGHLQNKQEQDDAFKGVVQSEYERVTAKQDSDITAGSSFAASKETDKISLGKLYKNDMVGAAQQEWAIKTVNETPFLYEDIKAISKTLATYGYSSQDTRKTVMQIGDAGAALGMSTQDMSMVATGLGRMQSTGKTTMEYMNLLIERGIPASEYLAEAYGKTQGEIAEMVSKGLIPGAEAAQIIADSMGKVNAGAMDEMSKTFGGLSSTVQGLEQEMQSALGEGFNSKRKEGLDAQVDFLSGESGQQMQEANKLIGEYHASQKNEQEKILREHQAAALRKIEEDGLTGAEAGRVLMEAQVAAENEYRKGEGYQLQLQTQTTMLDNLRMDLTDGWENFGHTMGQQFTFGIERGKADLWKELNPNNFETVGIPHRFIESSEPTARELTYQDYGLNPKAGYALPNRMPLYAFGLNYVPYDNFPALLHQGERVLTASEARSTNSTTQPVTITGNSFIVREEADIDRIATALYKQLAKARLTYAP